MTVVPSSLAHAAQMMKYLDERTDPGALDGCTAGDLNAVRAFVRGARVIRGDVSVFLAADDERSVFRFPLHRRGLPDLCRPIDPLLFGLVETGVAANVNDWGGGDFKDIMTGVDALIARGISDPDKLAHIGWSYGGYMTAWTITQTTRGILSFPTRSGRDEEPTQP